LAVALHDPVARVRDLDGEDSAFAGDEEAAIRRQLRYATALSVRRP
jgi:hypothetical protein